MPVEPSRQEGGSVKAIACESQPAAVSEGLSKPEKSVPDGTGGTHGMDGSDAGGPRKGVKGGVWFSLIDKVYRPRCFCRHGVRSKAKVAPLARHQSLEQFENSWRSPEKARRGSAHGSYRPRPIRRAYIGQARQQGQASAGDTGGARQSGSNRAQNGH